MNAVPNPQLPLSLLLVIVKVALFLLLITGAGLFIQSLNLRTRNLGSNSGLQPWPQGQEEEHHEKGFAFYILHYGGRLANSASDRIARAPLGRS